MEKYDHEMINLGLGKSTRIKHLKILLSLTRKINKDWSEINNEYISNLVKNIMKEYGDYNGIFNEKRHAKIFQKYFLGNRCMDC